MLQAENGKNHLLTRRKKSISLITKIIYTNKQANYKTHEHVLEKSHVCNLCVLDKKTVLACSRERQWHIV